MLLDHANEKFLDYRLEGKPLASRERNKLLREMEKNLDSSLLINGDPTDIPLYKLKIPGNKEESFILLSNNGSHGNIIRVPDSVFQILDGCNGISFEYQPCTNISDEAKKKFKLLIDKTISVIELIYHIMTKFHSSSNFDIYLSLVSGRLDRHCKMLNSFTKIMKVKERLGKNLNYIIVSMENIAFGMIDPEGCLLLENNQFNYKHLSFKPVISTDDDLKVSTINDNLSKSFNKQSSNKDNFKQIISSDIVSNWFSKIMDKKGHLFVIGSKYFIGNKGLKKILENRGCKLTKLNDLTLISESI